MSSAMLIDVSLDLAWRLWTELGVPGVKGMAGTIVVDPEPLVAWSPSVIGEDPRLRDLVFGWCQQHGDRLSASRLRGVLKTTSQGVTSSFGVFVTTLVEHSNIRWPGADEVDEPWPLPLERRELKLPVSRASMLRFRLRALSGVGTRADVLCELLGAGGAWLSASDLVEQGYTKRNIGRVLSELDTAGLVRSRADGNALRYQLADARALRALVAAPEDVGYPRWSVIFRLLALLVETATKLESQPPVVQRVEAHKAREQAEVLASQLGIAPPPTTAGNPQAFADFTAWAVAESRALAAGSSAALNRR